MFQIDQEALVEELSGSLDLSEAFAQAGTSLDLSGLTDLSSIQIQLPEMPAMSLEDLMSSLRIQVSMDSLTGMAGALLEGYQAYAVEHPEADYSGLGEDLLEYFRTEEARTILEQHVQAILEEAGTIPFPARSCGI